jgi:hypothetical protein
VEVVKAVRLTKTHLAAKRLLFRFTEVSTMFAKPQSRNKAPLLFTDEVTELNFQMEWGKLTWARTCPQFPSSVPTVLDRLPREQHGLIGRSSAGEDSWLLHTLSTENPNDVSGDSDLTRLVNLPCPLVHIATNWRTLRTSKLRARRATNFPFSYHY